MNSEELLAELMAEARKQQWKLMTHLPLRHTVHGHDGPKPWSRFTCEYVVRRMAFTPLHQEVVYNYFVGDFHIWQQMRPGYNPSQRSMIALSSNILRHMASEIDKAAFVAMTMDGIVYMKANDVLKAIGPGLLHRIKNMVLGREQPRKDVSIPLKSFSTKDPFKDYRPKFSEKQAQKLV
jgi:hypothetical protein